MQDRKEREREREKDTQRGRERKGKRERERERERGRMRVWMRLVNLLAELVDDNFRANPEWNFATQMKCIYCFENSNEDNIYKGWPYSGIVELPMVLSQNNSLYSNSF